LSLKGFYLLPHPPIVVPEVGKGEEKKIVDTSNSMDAIGIDIAKKTPDTIIIITPHGTMFQDAISILNEDYISGDLKKFRAPSVSLKIQVNKPLVSRIHELAYNEGISSIMTTDSLLKKFNAYLELDHGVIVPLYFVNKHYNEYKIVHITYAPFADIDLYKFGMLIKKAVEDLGEDAVIIASGDLSHKLTSDGPYGFNPNGEKFDKEFLKCLENGDVKGVFSIGRERIAEAGECGRRSVAILLGTLDGKKYKGELLSYEGTLGVGYGVMKFNVQGEDVSKIPQIEEIRRTAYENKRAQKDPYVRLARESLTTYLTTEKSLETIPDYITEEMKNIKRGVFVSLKKFGDLRGCIGTILPTTSNVSEEIIRNAIEAGINDPRFDEVEEEELLDLDFSVDVLTEPESCLVEELDPRVFGVIVRAKGRSGLLLPDLEEVDTVEEQLDIALRKGGIKKDENYSIERFKVIRHKES